jgi:C5HC2 zinc finger
MCNRELNDRAATRKQYPSLKEVIDDKDRTEGKTECAHCNAFTYLSQISCTCTEKVACADHLEEVRPLLESTGLNECMRTNNLTDSPLNL